MGKRRKRLTKKKYASKYATIRANIAKMKGLSPVEEPAQEAPPVLPDPPPASIVEPISEPAPPPPPEPVVAQPSQSEPEPKPVVTPAPKKVVKKPAAKKPVAKKTPAKPKTQTRVRKTSKKET